MTSGLQENLDWLKRHFSFPLNSGLVIRKFDVGRSSTEGAVIYLEGQVDWQHLNRTVLDPLIANNKPDDAPLDAHTLMDQMVTDCQVSSNGKLGEIVLEIVTGSAVIFVDGLPEAVIADVKGWEKRCWSCTLLN
jgi:spore germination protein KA